VPADRFRSAAREARAPDDNQLARLQRLGLIPDGGFDLAFYVHALEFETWQSLVRTEGLSRRAAIELMVRLVETAMM
jgi:hypothetical protein